MNMIKIEIDQNTEVEGMIKEVAIDLVVDIREEIMMIIMMIGIHLTVGEEIGMIDMVGIATIQKGIGQGQDQDQDLLEDKNIQHHGRFCSKTT